MAYLRAARIITGNKHGGIPGVAINKFPMPQVVEKIDRLENMLLKAEHVSFQGKNILKIGAGITKIF